MLLVVNIQDQKIKLKLKEHQKKYREENKRKIAERRGEKFDCECGGKYICIHKKRKLKCNICKKESKK